MWFRMRKELRETDVNRKALLETITDFVQKILPLTATLIKGTPKRELPDFSSPSIRTLDTVTASPSSPSTSREIIYETPKSSLVTGEIEEEDEDAGKEGDFTEKEVQ
jgi:hypothetical protein